MAGALILIGIDVIDIKRMYAQVPPTVSTILIDGQPITANVLNLITGPSIAWICSPVGASQLNCQTQVNTVTIPTKAVLQSGACTFLNSTNGSTVYVASLAPTCQKLTAYVKGMRFWLTTNAACPTSCTLNIDQVSQGVGTAIKRADGTTDPGGLFDFTKGVPIWFDGTLFRIEWQH